MTLTVSASLLIFLFTVTWASDSKVVEKTHSGVSVHEKHKSSQTKEDYYNKNAYEEKQTYVPSNPYRGSPNVNFLGYFLLVSKVILWYFTIFKLKSLHFTM